MLYLITPRTPKGQALDVSTQTLGTMHRMGRSFIIIIKKTARVPITFSSYYLFCIYVLCLGSEEAFGSISLFFPPSQFGLYGHLCVGTKGRRDVDDRDDISVSGRYVCGWVRRAREARVRLSFADLSALRVFFSFSFFRKPTCSDKQRCIIEKGPLVNPCGLRSTVARSLVICIMDMEMETKWLVRAEVLVLDILYPKLSCAVQSELCTLVDCTGLVATAAVYSLDFHYKTTGRKFNIYAENRETRNKNHPSPLRHRHAQIQALSIHPPPSFHPSSLIYTLGIVHILHISPPIHVTPAPQPTPSARPPGCYLPAL